MEAFCAATNLPAAMCSGWTWPDNEMTDDASFSPPSSTLNYNWVVLYLGALVCWLSLCLTRHSYKLSAGFRARVSLTGFDTVGGDAG